MSTNNSGEEMKAISESRLRVAIRAGLNKVNQPFGGLWDDEIVESLVTQIMSVGVEIQRPDTVLKSEYDLVVSKNATLVQLMDMMTSQLNAKSDSDPAKETDKRAGIRIRQADGSERDV